MKRILLLCTVLAMVMLSACTPADNVDEKQMHNPSNSTTLKATANETSSQVLSESSSESLSTSLEPTLSTLESEAEKPSFITGNYKVFYEVVPQSEYEQVIGSLEQHIKTDHMDMELTRLFYILYTGAEENETEIQLSSIWREIEWQKLIFTVNGIDYHQPSILMSTGTQTYITYLFVPKDTSDAVPVSIMHAGQP